YFSRTALVGFLNAARHLFQGKIVCRTTQRRMALALGKGAKAAFVGAGVGVIDVAIDDVSNRIADGVAPQTIGSLPYRRIVRTARFKQLHDLRRAQRVASHGVLK